MTGQFRVRIPIIKGTLKGRESCGLVGAPRPTGGKGLWLWDGLVQRDVSCAEPRHDRLGNVREVVQVGHVEHL